jgi:hypothetical protein
LQTGYGRWSQVYASKLTVGRRTCDIMVKLYRECMFREPDSTNFYGSEGIFEGDWPSGTEVAQREAWAYKRLQRYQGSTVPYHKKERLSSCYRADYGRLVQRLLEFKSFALLTALLTRPTCHLWALQHTPRKQPNKDFSYALIDAFQTGFKTRRNKPCRQGHAQRPERHEMPILRRCSSPAPYDRTS